jgi:hypothetical protein
VVASIRERLCAVVDLVRWSPDRYAVSRDVAALLGLGAYLGGTGHLGLLAAAWGNASPK